MTLAPPRRKPRWVTIDDVLERFSIGRSTLYEYIDPDSPSYIPEFPKPAKIGRSTRFVEDELDDYSDFLKRTR